MWKAKIIVTYKPGILNPEAKTIQHALGSLGYADIDDIDSGRYFQVTFDQKLGQAETVALTEEICEKVLSNPVIQKFSYELEEVSS